jgi:voltage-gated potassium channel
MNIDSPNDAESDARAVTAERRELLARLEGWLEIPMLVLGFVWLALLIWEFTRGSSPLLEAAGTTIWVIFILNFAVEFILAPGKVENLKRNWLTATSLVVPALRAFRIARVLRGARGLRLAKARGHATIRDQTGAGRWNLSIDVA